jgi:hypothetical protein
MNFNISAVQGKCLNPFDGNGLRLKFFFDLVEDATVDPTAKTPIDAISFAKVCREGTPATTIFHHVLQ